MLEQLFEDLKLNDGNKIVLGCRSMIWDYQDKKFQILEELTFANGYTSLGKFNDPNKALKFLLNI